MRAGTAERHEHAVAAPRSRLLVLDALRGAAALVVLFHHALTLFPATFAQLPDWAAAIAGAISRRNTEAVLLFFVLSGFSIRLSVEASGLRTRAALLDYARRRARRILPPYWLALACAGAVALGVAEVPPEATASTTLIGNLLFLQTPFGVPGQWFMPYAGNAPLWSLSFEVFFYAAYAGLAYAVSERSRRLWIVCAATVLGLGLGALAANPLAMFCAASLIWYFGVELAERWLRGSGALPLRVACVLWLVLSFARTGAHGRTLHGLWIGCGLFLLGALLVQSAPRLRTAHARLRKPLLAPLARAGAISYPLYLLHVPILRACAAALGDGAAALALGAGVSVVSAAVVERWLNPPRAVPKCAGARKELSDRAAAELAPGPLQEPSAKG